MIISASRRTDIPTYYSDWFFNRIKEGFVLRAMINVKLQDVFVVKTDNVEKVKKAIEEYNSQYLDQLEILVNNVLKYSFHDQHYEFKIVPEDKKIEFMIIDHLKGIEKTLDKFGGGISIVISIFLQIYFITERNKKRIILADECLYAISEKYREKFYAFIKKYSQENDFYIFVISHDQSTSKYMDYNYDIKEATVKGD